MDDVHLNPGTRCDGCWTYIMNRSSLGPKALLFQQPGKASVSTGNRFVHWSFPLLDGKIIYSWFPYTHSSRIYQLSFISFLMNNRVWLSLKVIVKQQRFPFLLGAALKKRFYLVAPNTNTLLISPANSEISQPAWRSGPALQYKWLPNKLFLHTELGKWQQNQLREEEGGAGNTCDFPAAFWFLYLSPIFTLLSTHYSPQSLQISVADLKQITFYSAIQWTKDVVRYKMFN